MNSLKETLAMQSAYVQTMSPLATSAGVQASTGTGTGMGTQYFPVSSVLYSNDPMFSDRQAWANSVDPDQTAPYRHSFCIF